MERLEDLHLAREALHSEWTNLVAATTDAVGTCHMIEVGEGGDREGRDDERLLMAVNVGWESLLDRAEAVELHLDDALDGYEASPWRKMLHPLMGNRRIEQDMLTGIALAGVRLIEDTQGVQGCLCDDETNPPSVLVSDLILCAHNSLVTFVRRGRSILGLPQETAAGDRGRLTICAEPRHCRSRRRAYVGVHSR